VHEPFDTTKTLGVHDQQILHGGLTDNPEAAACQWDLCKICVLAAASHWNVAVGKHLELELSAA
jgi:hypothetical protein